jgi:hypothetical protein
MSLIQIGDLLAPEEALRGTRASSAEARVSSARQRRDASFTLPAVSTATLDAHTEDG